MKSLVFAPIALAVFLACAQVAPPPEAEDKPSRLPNGKLQSEEILKADHERNLKDASELLRLSEEIKSAFEKNDRYILSLETLKKLDQMEKIAKGMRSRLKRF